MYFSFIFQASNNELSTPDMLSKYELLFNK